MKSAVGLILMLIILNEIIYFHATWCFVKQLLQKPPTIESRELWRRSPLNYALYRNFTLTLSESLEVPTPSYVQMLEPGTLSVTSFSLLRKGSIMQFDLDRVRNPKTFEGDYLWPNELSSYANRRGQKVMLIPDGFLMPGQDDGAVYAICDPDNSDAKPIRITSKKKGWFYHRAVHVTLPGTGVEGILTARARKPLLGEGEGELVWLSIPPEVNGDCWFQRNSRLQATNKEETLKDVISEKEEKQMYWEETVLATGPDVMFELVDLDKKDDTLEVVAAHFFGNQISIYSLQGIPEFPFVKVVDTSTIPTVGRPYGLCLATMSPQDTDSPVEPNTSNEMIKVKKSNWRRQHRLYLRNSQVDNGLSIGEPENHAICSNESPTHLLVSTHECSYDFPSAFEMAFNALIDKSYPKVKTPGGRRKSVHPGDFVEEDEISSSVKGELDDSGSSVGSSNSAGGSLFAYEIPRKKRKNSLKVSNVIDKPDRSPIIPVHNRVEPVNLEERTDVTNPVVSHQILPITGEESGSEEKEETKMSLDLSTWRRSTLFRGFKVRGWGGIFAPGAPGFPYVFRMPHKPQSPPLILLAGDCTGSAYVFSPTSQAMDEEEGSKDNYPEVQEENPLPKYELAYEIECGATVGSAAVCSVNDGSGDVNLYVPAYELNKRLKIKTTVDVFESLTCY